MIQSTPCGNTGYQGIDGAKLPTIKGYDHLPDVAARINRAVGGRNGRMPYWFQYSKNGRHLPGGVARKKKKAVKAANNSIMNRICQHFAGIGNINMNFAGIPPFNWEMLLKERMGQPNEEAIELFCQMDARDDSLRIELMEEPDYAMTAFRFEQLADQISQLLIERWGSLEAVYPSLVWFLFTGDNQDKVAHKQMFWRVFGDLAMEALEYNLIGCHVCPRCGMSTPLWANIHICGDEIKGFYVCQDCGALVSKDKSGPARKRCESCEAAYRAAYIKTWKQNKRRSAGTRQRGRPLGSKKKKEDEMDAQDVV